MNSRELASPPILLGLCLAVFVSALGLVAGGAGRPWIGAALLVLAALGSALWWALARSLGETEEGLRKSEHYIQNVAELSLDVHAIIDARHQCYLYMTPAVTKVLGYRPEAFIEGGLDFFYGLVHPEDLPQVTKGMERLLEQGPGHDDFIQEDIYRIRTAWEDYRWFRSRRKVYHRAEDGSPKDILVVARDITEQRGFEIALVQAQEFESMGILARRLAHDLNNILMGIQGYAELGLETPDEPGRMVSSLAKVRESADRATGICRQMLAFAGRGRPHVTRFQVNEAVREALPLVENLLPETIQLVLELEGDLPLVSADSNQVRYALLNLVVNAMETLGTRDGEIRIATSLKHLAAGSAAKGLLGDFVCLEVADSGPGWSEETLNGIGDPFFRQKHPGRGLGLLTVKGIATEHHGQLQVESVEGKGTLCRFYIPIAAREPLADQGDEGTPISAETGVVLLVDDEPMIRAVLSQGLENAGYKVIEAVDGVEGFGAFVRHRSSISVVLLDLTMPRMNGDEVFEEIHKVAPEVPVILMSGYSQPEATEALASKGLAAFLSKPCSIKEVLAVVRRVQAAPAGQP